MKNRLTTPAWKRQIQEKVDENAKILQELGEKSMDNIYQILAAVNETVFSVDIDGKEKRITKDEAKKILGNRQFLSGMQRSAFHRTAVRVSGSGLVVYFDSNSFFK